MEKNLKIRISGRRPESFWHKRKRSFRKIPGKRGPLEDFWIPSDKVE